MLVFIDETGSDRRDTMKKFGYNLIGKPLKALCIHCRGKHLTAIAALNVKEMLDCSLVSYRRNKLTFQEFIIEKLVHKLQPFNGTNTNSVIIMDSACLHDTRDVLQTLEGFGVLAYFLPYSPDLNPIEEAFSKVKYFLQASEQSMPQEDLETLIVMAFSSITASDSIGWIHHAGYYT